MIKIIDIIPMKCNVVSIEKDGNYNMYYRWSENDWCIIMGESIEPVYQYEELENLYQLYIKEIKNENLS